MAKILIVEDDDAMSSMLAAVLSKNKHVVEEVEDGASALERLVSYKYDLVVLDWHLPSMSGIELCKQIRANQTTVPVLMLTSRKTIDDKEEGFDSGVDDYMTKPIAPQEFEARVLALLRRSSTGADKKLTYKDLVLEPNTGRCTRGQRQLALAPKECELLELLLQHPQEALTRDAIISRLWGSEGSRASLANCLKRLRSKLNEDGEDDLIETLQGASYRLK